MYAILPQYKRPDTFAKEYISKKFKKVGVNRSYIYQLISKEKEKQGSTDIDVLVVDGTNFVKYRFEPTQGQKARVDEQRKGKSTPW